MGLLLLFALSFASIRITCRWVHDEVRDRDRLHIIPELWNRLNGKRVVYVVPNQYAPPRDRLLKGRHRQPEVDNRRFWVALKAACAERGVELHCTRLKRIPLDAGLLLCYGIQPNKEVIENLKKLPKERKILSIWDPPLLEPQSYLPELQQLFSKILTWRDDLADGKTFLKFHLTHPIASQAPSKPFESRALLTLIAPNESSSHLHQLYTKRQSAIDYFESHGSGDFTFYGPGWECLNYRTYGGTADDETLGNFRFCLAYENSCDEPGYISQVLLAPLAAHCVPVYLGDPNVLHSIPKECFIDRCQFDSDADLHAYLKAMTKEEYEGYQRAIDAFHASAASELFSPTRVADQFANEILAALENLKRAEG